MTEVNAIGGLAASVLVLLTGWAIIEILGGQDPNNTLLVILANHPDLFVGLIILLVIVGAILNIATRI